MADPMQLSLDQDDLPAVFIVRSPGAPGDVLPDTTLPPPRVPAAADLNERPARPRPELPAAVDRPVPTNRRERRLQQTLDNIGLLHALPRLQYAQLPLDLWTSMVALVPPGEEESFLFRYLFLSRLPSRLRGFASGLVNHSNWLLAEVCDYLWRTWLAGDPPGVPYFRPDPPAAARAAAGRRGGRSRRGQPHVGRAPSRSPPSPSSPPRGCLCIECRAATLRTPSTPRRRR